MPEPGDSERRTPGGRQDPEALRRQLRELGYLANPLERFLLGRVAGPASPLLTDLVVSLKVGVLAGLLLGGLFLVGFLLSHAGLAQSPGDVAVVTGYLIGLTTAFLVAASLAVGLLLHLLARLGGRAVPVAELIATRGAVVVAGAVFIYLACWWGATRAQRGWRGLGASDVAVVLGALVVCGLLAAALRVGGRSLLVHLEDRAPSPRRRLRLWRGLTVAALGAVGFFLVLYVGFLGPAEAPREPVEFRVTYLGARFYLIAVDGLSYRQATQYAEGNEASWLGRSAALAPLRLPTGQNTAMLWTTAATGLPPERHGVESFETTRISGLAQYVPLGANRVGLDEALRVVLPFFGFARRTPISSVSLTARPLWDIFAEKGLRLGVVNWWATWPAEEVRGVMISDRTFTKLDLAAENGVGPVKFESETYPEAAFDLAREVWERTHGPDAGTASVGLEMDRFHRALTLELLERAGTEPWPEGYDFLAVYLPGLDIAEHELLSRSDELRASRLESDLARLRREVRNLDVWLAEVAVKAQADEATVMVVGTPSRRDRAAGMQGFYALWGADVAGGRRAQLDLYDLAPTLLAAMGFPVSGEMPGTPRLELFSSARVAEKARRIASYGERRAKLGAPSSVIDREYRERLRAIGYID